LFAALGPVVDACEDGILVVKIVIKHGDEWGIKREVLLERARALHLKSDARDAVGKDDVRAAVLFRLRLPFVADRRAVGQQGERSGDFAGSAFRRLDVGRAFGEPAAFGRRDLELFAADGLPGEFYGELSFVLDQDARRGFFLTGESGRGHKSKG
jgi:hypothetical protein